MFAPAIGHGEDPVTGSMHSLLAPFWITDFRRNESFDAKIELALRSCQASAREGIIEVVWKEDGGTVLIRGDGLVMGKGEMTF
jgi:predicted PhzF superfamily epimerase YddE/YHI9